MKTIYSALIIVSALGLLMGCQKESDFTEELTQPDQFALDGMSDSYAVAATYNDSLSWCTDNSTSCTASFVQYCDSIYHENVKEYGRHHDSYSHYNFEDDHHHGSGNRDHGHGGNMGNHNNSDNHAHHNQGDHNEMNELNDQHNNYHPL